MRCFLACIFLCLAGVSAAFATTEIWTPDITTNTTWGPTGNPPDSVYLIQVDVTVRSSARLTIQPGTTLRFAQNKRLAIGTRSTPGYLTALGSVEDPIVFTGNVATPGYWDGLAFDDFSDAGASCQLDHCVIEYGGGPDTGALIWCQYTNAPVASNCILRHSAARGLYAKDWSAPTLTSSLIEDCATYPIDVSAPLVGPMVSSNTILPNQTSTYNAIYVRAGTISTSVTWPTPTSGLCYLVDPDDDIAIEGVADPVLTLLPGTVIKSRGNTMWNVGTYNGENGGMRATNVLFTSAYDDTVCDATGDGPTAPAPGDWQNVTFWERALDAECVLDGCTLRFGGIPDGNTHGVISIRGSQPTVTSCLLDRNDYSLGVVTADAQPFITQCVIESFERYAVYLHPMGVEGILRPEAGNVLVPRSDARLNVVLVKPGTLSASATWPVPPPGFTYRVETNGDITIAGTSDPVLTLLPGTIVKHQGGTAWNVGQYNGENGGMRATGVLFTSVFDDTLGDALGDGPVPPNPGDWQNIIVNSSAIGTECVLDSCTFRYGGFWGHPYWPGTVVVDGAQPTIQECVFDENAYSFCVLSGTPQPYVQNCLTQNFQSCSIYLHPMAVESVLRPEAGNVFIPNATGQYNTFRVRDGTITINTTWPVPPPGFTYRVETNGDITIAGTSDPVLTLLPGTIVKHQGGTAWNVGQYNGENGGMRATGVLFTSVFDDTLGDALGDGPVPPNPGDWQNVIFNHSALDAESVLEDCALRYGGYNGHPFWHGVVYADDASPTVIGCRVDHALRAGMYFVGSGEAPVVLQSCVNACERGIRCDTGPGTIINDCDIWGNSLAGIENLGAELIDAEQNWWGAQDGPSGEGPGSGDGVYGPVDYSRWLTEPRNCPSDLECWHHILSFADFDGIDRTRSNTSLIRLGLYSTEGGSFEIAGQSEGCLDLVPRQSALDYSGCQSDATSISYSSNGTCEFTKDMPFEIMFGGDDVTLPHKVVADYPMLADLDFVAPNWGGFGSLEDLLDAYAPILNFEMDEKYFPIRAELALVGARLSVDGPDAPPGLPAFSDRPISTGDLATYSWSCFLVDEPYGAWEPDQHYDAYLAALNAWPEDSRHVVYATGIRDRGQDGELSLDDRVVLQYWMYYYFNDNETESRFNPSYQYRQIHEGDWEHVSVMLDLSLKPLGVAFASHGSEAVPWAEVTKVNNTHPQVFVAKGAHGNYRQADIDYVYVPWAIEHPLGWVWDYHEGGRVVTPRGLGGGEEYDVEILPRWSCLEGENRWVEFSGFWGKSDEGIYNGEGLPFYKIGTLQGVRLIESPVWRGPAFREEWASPVARDFKNMKVEAAGCDIVLRDSEGREAGPNLVTIPWAIYEPWSVDSLGTPLKAGATVTLPTPAGGHYTVTVVPNNNGTKAANRLLVDEAVTIFAATTWIGVAPETLMIAENVPLPEVPPDGYDFRPAVPRVGHSELDPSYWNLDWLPDDMEPITWRLSSPDSSFQISDVVVDSLRLNGVVSPVGPPQIDNGVLVVSFPRGPAVYSLDEGESGTLREALLTGVFSDSVRLVSPTSVWLLTTVGVPDDPTPTRLRLSFPRGNITSGAIDMKVDLPVGGHVQVMVFDVRGRLVATVADENRNSGPYILHWDARSTSSRRVASGVYFVQVVHAGRHLSGRVIILR